MITRIVAIVLTATLVCLPIEWSSKALAVEEEIAVVGSSKIIKGDMGSAREAAIDQALGRGLESYLIKKLGPKTFADYMKKIITSIIPAARECTASYHLMAEYREENNLTVLLAMKVNELITDARLKDAGISKAEAPKGRILLLLKEVDEDKGVSFHWWRTPDAPMTAIEMSLYSALQARGYEGANRTLTPPDISQEMTKAEIGDDEVKRWGKFFSADIVTYGIFIKSGKSNSIRLRLIDASSGRTSTEEVLIRDEDGAEGFLDAAAEKIAGVASTFRLESASLHQKELVFEGLSEASQINQISASLSKDLPWVKNVTPSRVTKSSAAFRMSWMGEQESLVTQLLQRLPYRWELIRSTEKEVVFRLLGP
jgi:hypothetical protein